MNKKALITLEYPKIIARLKSYADFSASADLADELVPTADLTEARQRQTATREARLILSLSADISFSHARDIRPQLGLARRNGVLEPEDLIWIKNTLIVSRTVRRVLDNMAADTPQLSSLAVDLPVGLGLVDQINKTISEHGEVLDSASPRLGEIRREMKITHERMMNRMQRFISDSNTSRMLQEPIITQRNGRNVLPLRAEFKGKIKAVIHDQSSSGSTLFIEPIAVVEWNNRLRELELAERDEIHRILAALSAEIALHDEPLHRMVAVMAELDLAFMCARFADHLDASEPELLPFEERTNQNHPGSTIRLYQVRHPLLDPHLVVPIDVDLDRQTFALVITGPNTGGKTVTLKSVGLLVLMAQSGLPIPALSGSKLTVFEDVFADIGDEQSIEQSLSTFSGHVTNIVSILKEANERSLVLLDELGAGTDPQEGSALARAVTTHLLERRVTSLIATHYPELKAFAHTTAGIQNASVEFNLQTLQPTYHLTIGLPGRSNALAIAERLGLPQEIITAARAEIDPTDLRAEDLLDEIHRQRDLARQARESAESTRLEVEGIRRTLSDQLNALEDERHAILENARQESERQLLNLQEELAVFRSQLTKASQPLAPVEEIEHVIEEKLEVVQEPVVRKTTRKRVQKIKGPLKPGEKVHLQSLGQDGVVTSVGEDEVEVQLGRLRIRARLADIVRKGQPAEDVETDLPIRSDEEPPTPEGGIRQPMAAGRVVLPPLQESPGVEIDLRGQRVDEGLDALGHYLERAYLAGLPFVRIIHGKGTGRLREAIREKLAGHPHVSQFESGEQAEGGDGVTIAHLKSN